jgi:uncharacterized Zn finger protein
VADEPLICAECGREPREDENAADERPSVGRESVEVKGRRLLVEGRLIVERVEGGLVVASWRGDSGEVYRLGHDPRAQEWRCSCPARGRCSHLVALQLVTVLRIRGHRQPTGRERSCRLARHRLGTWY